MINKPLLQWGEFSAHSGRRLLYKIECDALSAADWDCAANLILRMWPEFGGVFGIPRGGLPLANRLQHHVTEGSNKLLIVDDVTTTGSSLNAKRRELHKEFDLAVFQGACLFARGPIPVWVKAVFYTAIEIW